MYRNPFVVFRFVAFSTMAYLNFLMVIFAALNVGASKAAGVHANGATVLLIVITWLLFFGLTMATSELLFPRLKIASHIKYECTWTAVLGLMQLVTTLVLSFNGPPSMCLFGNKEGSLNLCTTSSVLVQIAWLLSFTLVGYSTTLIIMTLVHAESYPGIWSVCVCAIPWFMQSKSGPNVTIEPGNAYDIAQALSKSKFNDKDNSSMPDIEAGPYDDVPIGNPVAPWATNCRGRRGVDPPFATREEVLAANGGRSMLSPLSRLSRYTEGLLWFGAHRKSQAPTLPITTAPPSVPPKSPTKDQEKITDEDKPIPLPNIEDWYRAEALKTPVVQPTSP